MEQLTNEFKAQQFADLKHNRSSYAWNVAYESYLAALLTEQNFCKPDVSGSDNPIPLQKQIDNWKTKAEKWDALGEKIAAFYVDDNDEELSDDEGGDLCDIGEAAASAYGWL